MPFWLCVDSSRVESLPSQHKWQTRCHLQPQKAPRCTFVHKTPTGCEIPRSKQLPRLKTLAALETAQRMQYDVMKDVFIRSCDCQDQDLENGDSEQSHPLSSLGLCQDEQKQSLSERLLDITTSNGGCGKLLRTGVKRYTSLKKNTLLIPLNTRDWKLKKYLHYNTSS